MPESTTTDPKSLTADQWLRRLLHAQGLIPDDGGGAKAPAPTPPVSDELAGSPAYADSRGPAVDPRTGQARQYADVLAAQGQASPQPPVTVNVVSPPSPPGPSPDATSGAGPIVPQDTSPGTPVPLGNPPVPQAPGDQATQPNTSQTIQAPSGDVVPPQYQDTTLGRLLRAQGIVPNPGISPLPPTRLEAHMATRPEDQQLAYRNTDIGRRGNDSVRPGTVDDEILAHDLDTTTWSPPAAPPPGLTSTQGTGPDATTLRPGQYFDASGGVVYRTGDPDRDARLQADEARAQARITGSPGHRGFVGSTFEGPETRNKTAKEIEAERGGQVNGVRDLAQAAAGMPGETVQVESTRPDPMAIDALTRRYAVDAIDRAGPVTRYDAQGNALPPSEEDLAYQQSMAMDQTFQDRVEAMARERAVEEERARQRLPHQEQLTALTDDVTAEQARALSKYVAMRRDFWDKARRAQARADAAYPNPDDLLGGRGSWGRALALGIAAGGGPTGAALVNNALEMQAAGQGARYNRERQRASDALGNAEEAGREAGFETQTSNAILAAAKERVASQFDTIAAQTADQALQAKYQSMAADIRASYTKDLGSLATQMANRDLRESQLAMKGMHYDSKLHRWVSMFGDNGGGGAGGPGGPPGGVVASPTNPFGKSGVREPDRGGRPGGYWQAKDEDSAKKATEAGEEYIRLDDSLNDMQVIAREVQGAKSLGGQAWDRWKSENDARYKNALINGAQVAARVLHGRPPGKFTMQEVQEEFPDLARMWEANNVEGVIRSLRDTSDRQYNKAMHQYGYNGTYRSDRPTTAEPGNVNIYARDIVGDYVKGGSQGADFVHNAVGGGSDPTDRGALGKYVTSYLDNNIGDTNALVESLKTIMTKALGNRLKATQAGDRKGANAFQVIADAIKSQIAEVRSKKTQTDRERASMKSTVDAAQDPLRNPTVFP